MTTIQTKPNIERLKTLYAMMAGIPESAINMGWWRSKPSEFYASLSDSELLRNHTCGTTACMLGWAAAYPEFKAQGLRYRRGEIRFDGVHGMSAGARFFGIEELDSHKLFSGSVAPNESHRQTALRRVRRLLLKIGAITPRRNAELAREDGALE